MDQQTMGVTSLGCNEENRNISIIFGRFIVGFCMIHAESKNTPIIRTSSNHFPMKSGQHLKFEDVELQKHRKPTTWS